MVVEKKKAVVSKAPVAKKSVAADSGTTTKTAAKKAPVSKKAVPALPSVWPFPVMETEPPVKKAAAQKIVASKTTTDKPATKKAPAPKASVAKTGKPTPEERYRMVETAAYFIAERSGFRGCTTEHWAAAEIEIADKLDR